MIVAMSELLSDAEKGNYALPALNFCSLETMYPAFRAARALRAPVIMQAAMSEVEYFGEDLIAECVRKTADRYQVPTALHLDHGHSFTEALKCIRKGFSSVMFDGSALDYSDNVVITRSIVQAAHAVGVSVEGELGKIMGVEEASFIDSDTEVLTEPEKAGEFAQETQVDALAVAIGSAHGFYTKEPRLDFERLSRIRQATRNLPIVLHGGTGIPDDSITQAISLGIRKINFSTILRAVFIQNFREQSNQNVENYSLMELSNHAMTELEQCMVDKINLLGCAGQF